MISKRRNLLRNYVGREATYIGTVELIDLSDCHMIISDVYVKDDKLGLIKVAPHLHLYRIKPIKLKKLNKLDIIIFNAEAYSYTRSYDFETFRNFSLGNVKRIRKVEGEYYEN